MTPRRLLRHARTDAEAQKLARKQSYDAIPIIRKDGLVREFWSRSDEQKIRITRRHSAQHNVPVERLLPVLGAHIVQFVYYRSEMVGLIDASDLNKPRACLAWLEPMLELERAILDVVVDQKINDKEQEKALGNAAKATLPLLEYAQFHPLLQAARSLMIISLSNDEIIDMNKVRRRSAHAGGGVIQDRSDCLRLKKTLVLARKVASSISRRRV